MKEKNDRVPLIDSTIESRESEESLERTEAELRVGEADEKEREANKAKLRNIFHRNTGDRREPQ